MKPKNNRVMCPDCGKPKMLFESESKANNFIKWNGDEIDAKGGELRAYYCPACCGWHITHQKHKQNYEFNTERLIDAYKRDLNNNKCRLSSMKNTLKIMDKMSFAKEIWKSMLEEAKTNTKNTIKDYITEYFSHYGVNDNSGLVRKMVYDLWRDYKCPIVINKG